jgi:uncharacterized protein YbcI
MLESQIVEAAIKFQREQHGRGPADVQVSLIGDIVLVRCRRILTPSENRLAGTEDGRRLIKLAREELRSINQRQFDEIVSRIVSCRVCRSYEDINVEAGEMMIVFVLDSNVEELLDAARPGVNGLRVTGNT